VALDSTVNHLNYRHIFPDELQFQTEVTYRTNLGYMVPMCTSASDLLNFWTTFLSK